MPTIIQTFQGRVTGLWGTALMRGTDGLMHPLQLGDLVHRGDVILTSQDGIVRLTPDDAEPAPRPAEAPSRTDIDRVITGLNEAEPAGATAAGALVGDGAGTLVPGLRVDRIAETVTPASLALPDSEARPRTEPIGVADEQPTPAVLDADSNTIQAVEDGAAAALGLNSPTGASAAAVIRVTQLPLLGELQYADGTPVALGSVLTTAQLTGLIYLPPADVAAGTPPGVFVYTVTDHGVTVTGGVVIDLTAVNDAPVGNADIASTPEDVTLAGHVIANDTDGDGDALTLIGFTVGGIAHPAGGTATLPGIGTITMTSDGGYTFVPAPNYDGAVPTVTYTLGDGSTTSTATLTLSVTPVNDAPVAADDAVSTPINTPLAGIAVLSNDTDLDGDRLVVTSAGLADPSQGTVTVNPDGTLNFTPATNLSGPVVITYTVSDGQGGGDTATLTVNVGPNTPPDGADTVRTIAEDTPYTVRLADLGFADADAGQALAGVRIDILPAAGTLLLNGVAVAVGALVSPAAIAAGELVFVPAANANGAPYAAFGFSVQDSAGALDTAPNTLTINVTPVDDLPVAVADRVTSAEDQPLNGSVASNDTLSADGGNVFALVSGGGPAHGSLVFNADGTFAYTPDAHYNGADAFTYSLTDADGSVSTATVEIDVTPLADAPFARPDTASAPEDSPIVGNVLANDSDADGDPLQVTQFVVGGFTHAAGSTATLAGVGTLTIQADGSYVFAPVADYNGPVPVATYTVSDGSLASSSTLTLSVTPVDDAPVLSLDADQSHNTVAVQAIAGLFNTGESDTGGVLALGQVDPHYSVVSQPTGGTVSNTTVQLGYSWLPGDADASWIGSIANEPQGLYTYQTGFTLQAGADPRTVQIAFDLASDNSLVDVLVNGVSTGITSNGQYGTLTPIALNGANMAFQDGANTITFVVDNRDSVAYMPGEGPTGLLIDNMSGSVAVIVPSATTALGDYGTIFVEGGGPVSIADTDTRVTDVDSPTLQSATITLTNAQPGDVLSATALPPGIVASVDPTGTVVTLTGSASLAAYEAAIHAVQFANTASDPSSAIDRIVTVVVRDDTGLSSNVATTTVHVVPVDAPPALDLDGNDSTATGAGYAGTFVENGSGVPIVDLDAVITDADSTTLHSATIHLTNVRPGDLLAIGGALPAGISAAVYDPTNGVLTLSGSASLADYQAALRTVTFANTSDSPDPTTRVIEIRVNDAGGHSDVATAQITVVPVNDAPSGADVTLTTLEDTAHVLGRADFGFTDPLDGPANGFVAVTVNPVSAGLLTLDGVPVTSATLVTAAQLDAGLLQFMPAPNANGSAYATLTFRVSDDGGTANGGVDTDPTPNTITFDVTPVDEVPVAVADAVAVTEDTPFSGSVASNDLLSADGGNVFALVAGPTNGGIVFNADGTFTYTPNADYNGPDSFTYVLTDADGSVSTAVVTLDIGAVNDAPAVQADLASGPEDAPITGNVLSNDSDVDGPTLQVTQFVIGGTTYTAGSTASLPGIGNLTIEPDGSYVFTPVANYDGPVPVVTYTATDGALASGATLSLSIDPVDDAPVISSGTGSVTENTSPIATGTLTASDVDNPALRFVPDTFGGNYGSLVLQADGSWTYALDARAEPLAEGQVVSEQFEVELSDGSTTFVTITVTGTNDPAVVTGPVAGTVTEDGTLTTGGVLAATDVDGPATFVPRTVALAYGDFSIDAAGVWSYTLRNADANVQALTSSQHPTETVRVTTADGTPIDITVTVNGANEVPNAAVSPASGDEDVTLPITLAAIDSDGTVVSFTVTALPLNGTLLYAGNPVAVGMVIPASAGLATLAFVPDPGWNGSTSLNFSATDNEGAVSAVVGVPITIRAVNDPPLAVADTAVAVEAGGVANGTAGTDPSGNVLANDTDADPGDSPTVTAVSGVAAGTVGGGTTGLYGTLALDADGHYTYTVDNALPAVQALRTAGDTLVDTFTYTVTDSGGLTSTATLQVTINGANDTPVAVADAAAVTEDVAFAAGVLGNDTDVDAGETRQVVALNFGASVGVPGAPLAGVFGTLTMQADGSYTYLANLPAAQALVAGQVVTEQFTYTMRDTAGATSSTTLTLTITGTDDVPVISGPLTGAVKEDTTLVSTGTLTITDADAGQAAFVAQPGTPGTYGMFVLTAAGVWTYTLNNAAGNVQSLPGTGALTESFTVTSIDGSTRTVVVTVNGTNDVPTSPGASFTVAEDAPLVSGSVTGSDVDTGAVLTFALTGAAPAGLVFNADGSYTFDPGNVAYQALGAGQSQIITVPYQVSDAQGGTSLASLTITVNGVDDAPVAASDTATAVEAGGVANGTSGTNPSGNVLANDTDVDAGDTKTVSAVSGAGAGSVGGSTAGLYGTLVLAANGSYTYTVDNTSPAVQALRTAGDTLVDSFSYTVRDAAGLTSTATLTVTINGANDTPVAVADAASVTEDVLFTSAAAGVLANDTDVDGGDIRQVAGLMFGASSGVIGAPLAGVYGTLTMQADGSYTYLADRAAAQALAAGQTATEQFVYTVRDAAGATASTTLTLTITGTNDAPVIAVPAAQTTLEDAPRVFSTANGNAITVADVDGDVLTTTLTVANGTLTLGSTAGVTVGGNGTGSVTVTGTAATINAALNGTSYASTADYNGTDTLNVTTSDGSLSDAEAIAITIAQVVDIRGNTYLLNEDTSVTVFELADDSFENAGRAITAIDGASIVAGGSVAVSNGTVTLQASGALTFVPTPNYSGTTSFTYTVASGGVTETATVLMQVAPVSDAPAGTDKTVTLAEDTTRVLTRADFGFTDPNDAPANNFASVTVGPASAGTLTLNGVTVTSSALVTVAQLDAGLLRFAPPPNANGTAYATLQFQVRDDGGTANGGADTDASPNTLSFDVTPVNDPATLGGLRTGATVEDGTLTASGTLTVSDIDTGEAAFIVQNNIPGAYGSFSVDAAGAWTYVLNNASPAVQSLAQGQSAPSEVFTVASVDGTTTTVTVSVTGTNDAPVAVDDIVLTNIAIDQNVSIGRRALLSNDIDVDTGATLSLTATYNAVNGTVSGTNPVLYKAANSFGASAQTQAEAPLFPGDSETNPLNNSMATAYEITRNRFGLPTAADAPYVASALLPSFKWTGRVDDVDGTPAATDQDWLKVYLRAGETIVLDVDGADSGNRDVGSDPVAVDMYLQLYDASGALLAQNDDADYKLGGLGSVSNPSHPGISLDSYLEYTVAADGYYYVNATAWNNNVNGILQDDGDYQLWLSIQPTAAASTGSFDYNMTDSLVPDAGHVTVTNVYSTTINGTAANEILIGAATNDTLNAGGGNDWVQGGAGNDTLTGGAGADVFAWVLADRGTPGTPAVDTITDFSAATPAAGGDVLDLRDLLQGEAKSGTNPGNLQNYLEFDTTSAPGSTVIHVSTTGGFASGFYSPPFEDERIVLQGVNVRAAGTFGLSATATDYDIIQQLLQRGKLVTDGP
jgi:VCBS repeat-containing protein